MSPRLARLIPPALIALVPAPLFAACSASSKDGGAAASTTTVTTVAVTQPAPSSAATTPPTTAYAPATPQPSPDVAAAALISDWASGSRAAAAQVAAPAAVSAVFAQPYPYSYMQPRGCTDAGTNPGTCTYANRQNGALYQITVSRAGSGWYVSSVSVES